MKEINPSDIVTTEENEKIFFSFEADLEANEISDSKINPTEVEYEKVEWLYASNNKYPEGSVNHDKVGKWMLFIKPKWVSQAWSKIKSGIAKGELWDSKVTTNNPGRLHAIMIYTKDYTDLEDVIRVLDYLERTRLKPIYINIRYKANWQTGAGIYSGGKERPWIYASETVRELAASKAGEAATISTIASSSIVELPSSVIVSSGLFSEKNKKTTAVATSEISALITVQSNMTMDISTKRASSAAAAVVSETAAVKGKSKKQPVCTFFNGAPGSCNKVEAC